MLVVPVYRFDGERAPDQSGAPSRPPPPAGIADGPPADRFANAMRDAIGAASSASRGNIVASTFAAMAAADAIEPCINFGTHEVGAMRGVDAFSYRVCECVRSTSGCWTTARSNPQIRATSRIRCASGQTSTSSARVPRACHCCIATRTTVIDAAQRIPWRAPSTKRTRGARSRMRTRLRRLQRSTHRTH